MNYRRPYTLDEDNLILTWIVKSKLFYALRGTTFWKDLSQAYIFESRSWQSLQNRFEKKVFPDLSNPRYTISEMDKAKITLAWQQTADNFDSGSDDNADGSDDNADGSDDNADDSDEKNESVTNNENEGDSDTTINTDSENEFVTSTVDT